MNVLFSFCDLCAFRTRDCLRTARALLLVPLLFLVLWHGHSHKSPQKGIPFHGFQYTRRLPAPKFQPGILKLSLDQLCLRLTLSFSATSLFLL